ncbi:MAG: M20/M25/M40 family metallo-hydrolase [Pyrinomonadaceae bacterium]|nr:M20/M25/M40 family metallo-hydrolase [Pyrinomonadaceae bacterium]MBA3766760.1 M20/M25/M40 family metallo-hydrolase [Acidobacteriota bacterium]
MKYFLFSCCLALLIFQPVEGQRRSNINAPAQAWWEHIKYLADDKNMGRETGSEGHRRAAQYVANVFKRAGLKPGGTSLFYQLIKFRARRIVEQESSLALIRNGKTIPIVLGDEATFNIRVDNAPQIEAPVVFVGYGLTVPDMNYDDLAGLDLQNKVVLLLSGAPSNIPGPLRSHYQSERWKFLKRAGAIGVLSIQNPKGMDIPWERSKLNRFLPSMVLDDPSLDETAGQRLGVSMNPATTEKFFEGSGHSFKEILELANNEKPLPKFSISASVRATVKVTSSSLESQNVVGILPGTDPRLKNEYVVLSAHLDHLGVSQQPEGDRIYNGAMDNASGIATLLETARALGRRRKPLRRSVVFLAVTAEEKGLLGSKYFAHYPTVPPTNIVANVNVDMFLPLFPLRSLIVQGLEESDIAVDLRLAGDTLGIKMISDPEPERNSFTRSDQYNFVKRGVPAVSLKIGFVKNSPEHETVKSWRTKRYHDPSDDLQQPMDFEAAVDFNRIYLRIVESMANRPKRPQWNNDSFFKRFAFDIKTTP